MKKVRIAYNETWKEHPLCFTHRVRKHLKIFSKIIVWYLSKKYDDVEILDE